MDQDIELEERQTGIYRLLKLPFFYTTAMRWISSSDALGVWVNQFVQPKPGMKILDVGSGTSSILSVLGDVEYHGIEPNELYVKAARERWGDRATFQVGTVEDLLDMQPNTFDVVLAVGVLHHVSDGHCKTLFEAGSKLLVRGGRMITLDGAYTPEQSVLSRLVVSRDRGSFVRDMDSYTTLALAAGLDVRTYYTNRMLRIPYSHVTLVVENA